MGGGASPLEIHHGDCVEFLSARTKQSIDKANKMTNLHV
jgi:hypothetical protein